MKLIKMIPEMLVGVGAAFSNMSVLNHFNWIFIWFRGLSKIICLYSFSLSFEFIVVFFGELKIYAKNNKALILIVSIFIAICYADLRFFGFSEHLAI